MKTILVPLDGSAVAEQVLPYARLLAPILTAKVHLLSVITDEQKQHLIARYAAAPPGEGGRYETEWDWERRAQTQLSFAAEGYLIAQAQLLRTAGLHVTYEVASGAPAECIVDTAASESEALIAMATHGYSGLRRWTLGSVADKVVQNMRTPVFLVRTAEPIPASRWSVKRILLPLDGSDLAERALPLAIELAKRAQAELIVLQALIPLAEEAPGLAPFARLLPPPPVAYPEALREQARQQLATIIDRVDAHGASITPVVVFGSPAEAIVGEAARHHVDLIVMATHGYGGLRRLALGSVADKVLHTTSAPLLLVHMQPAGHQPASSGEVLPVEHI